MNAYFFEKFLSNGGTVYALFVDEDAYLDYLPKDERDAHARRLEVRSRLKQEHTDVLRQREEFRRKWATEA